MMDHQVAFDCTSFQHCITHRTLRMSLSVPGNCQTSCSDLWRQGLASKMRPAADDQNTIRPGPSDLSTASALDASGVDPHRRGASAGRPRRNEAWQFLFCTRNCLAQSGVCDIRKGRYRRRSRPGALYNFNFLALPNTGSSELD